MKKKLNLLLKLKLLKLIYISKLNCTNKYLTFFFFYLNNSILVRNNYNNYLNITNYNYLFNNTSFNQFFFYNLYLNKFININNNTNYNFNYLIFYYYNYNLNSNYKNISNFYKNNLFFIKYFIVKFIYNYLFDKKIMFNIQKNNYNLLEKSSYYLSILNKTKRFFFLKEINISIKSFISFLFSFLVSKDIILFKNFIKYCMENVHFKKHRRFLYNLKVLLSLIFNIFSSRLGVLGLYIKIKGKIGVGGNLKKRKYSYKQGSFSFTKKNQKLNYYKDCIRTYSGVLGLEVYITYK